MGERERKNNEVKIDLAAATRIGPVFFGLPGQGPRLSTVRLRAVDRCIYCGIARPPLTREHIVPLAMGGIWVLERASCGDCARATARIEGHVLRHYAGAFRAALNFPTRRPRARPSTEQYVIVRDGKEHIIDVALTDYVPLLGFPVFAPPASAPPGTIRVVATRGIQALLPSAKYQTMEDLGRAYGAQTISYKAPRLRADLFAKLVAKIAYGFSVAEFGFDAFDDVYVLPALLGGDDIATWVGGADHDRFGKVEPHDYMFSLDVTGDDVWATVKILARIGGPEYVVHVGRLREPVATAVGAA